MTSQFEVSITNTFEAESLHDAVKQMRDWFLETNLSMSGYKVVDQENDRTYIVDGVDGGIYQIKGSPDGEEG